MHPRFWGQAAAIDKWMYYTVKLGITGGRMACYGMVGVCLPQLSLNLRTAKALHLTKH